MCWTLIKDVGLMGSKSMYTPLPQNCQFDDGNSPLLNKPDSYHRLIGYMVYHGFTQPDITHATQ